MARHRSRPQAGGAVLPLGAVSVARQAVGLAMAVAAGDLRDGRVAAGDLVEHRRMLAEFETLARGFDDILAQAAAHEDPGGVRH